MDVSTRVIGDASYSLYRGDVIEGQEAAAQVAAGNAEEIPDEEVPAEAEISADEAIPTEPVAEAFSVNDEPSNQVEEN